MQFVIKRHRKQIQYCKYALEHKNKQLFLLTFVQNENPSVQACSHLAINKAYHTNKGIMQK